MTQEQRDALIASLSALPTDSLVLGVGRYFDWSIDLGDAGVRMEVGGDGDDAVQLDMTRDQILSLQQRLTAWLLRDAA